ncbi:MULTISPECIES: hypothetical protein [unclassified Methanosarcina]|uniref:hypothetical protein n=1 Tax=unclassified Methanosarcina TaxID=2644672 RepID=UPI000621E0F6|nr:MULTISPECIES: hypothetical protein [unclassified Methanosarcina]KKG13462.1 hypothetical protein EO94_10760 [Methanosarcina sp. 2.H.T.1A.3]KKG24703.1 hypothetical protein EO96_13395 [Methanosarcina sp. 2.H.T.1A.8]
MKSIVLFLEPVFRLLLYCKSPEGWRQIPEELHTEVRRVITKTLLAVDHYLQAGLSVNLLPSNQLNQLNQPYHTRLELN